MSLNTTEGAGRVETQAGGRRKFTYKAENTELVTDGYMALRDAQDVFTNTLVQWGFTNHRDADIEPLAAKVAHSLRQGTAAERDLDKVWFDHNGVRCVLGVLRLEAGKKDNSENPVRVWSRSYNRGEMAVRTYDMLKDPENVSLREEAALDYGCSLDVVHVSFDFADALPKYQDMRLSQVERLVIKMNTANKVRASRSTHLNGTDGGSVQDSASHAAAVEAAGPMQQTSVMAGINPGGSGKRAAFAPVR